MANDSAGAHPSGLQVTILSPEKQLYAAEAESVTVPGEKGRFEILKNHAPIVSTLVAGTVTVGGANPLTLPILSGFVEVANNQVSICVEV